MPITDIKNLKEKDADIFFLRKFIPTPYDVSTLNYNADDEFCNSEQYFEVDETLWQGSGVLWLPE